MSFSCKSQRRKQITVEHDYMTLAFWADCNSWFLSIENLNCSRHERCVGGRNAAGELCVLRDSKCNSPVFPSQSTDTECFTECTQSLWKAVMITLIMSLASEYWCLIQYHIIDLNAVNLVYYYSCIALFSSRTAKFISEIQSVDMLEFCQIMWDIRELLYICVNTDDVLTYFSLFSIFLYRVLWCLFVVTSVMLLFEWPFPPFSWIWPWGSFSTLFATRHVLTEIWNNRVLRCYFDSHHRCGQMCNLLINTSATETTQNNLTSVIAPPVHLKCCAPHISQC